MYTVILFSLLSAALFYLGSRARITERLWSKYPPALARFMDCAACTGFWWGILLAIAFGAAEPTSYFGLDVSKPITWPLVGLCSIVLTPIAAGLMQHGLDQLGVAVVEQQPDETREGWTKVE